MVSMRLFVNQRSSSGRLLQHMMVDSDDTIAVAKEQLQSTSGIPVESQNLFFGRTQLDDNKQFRHYGIRAGGFLDLKEK
ncbi:expressed unknown protein [Seminavis robusta]|uniref:Ubiquitin-like domain-containing protein n=1 Tax=Seminavis robusta TaxID=568900 RepID=A0A9N8DG19_9STRA|nr:expressed unknown protein [Seminavis robusta]|eukprot:Sro133_g063080.1 n/a (79) ;mRNA; r:67583-67980